MFWSTDSVGTRPARWRSSGTMARPAATRASTGHVSIRAPPSSMAPRASAMYAHQRLEQLGPPRAHRARRSRRCRRRARSNEMACRVARPGPGARLRFRTSSDRPAGRRPGARRAGRRTGASRHALDDPGHVHGGSRRGPDEPAVTKDGDGVGHGQHFLEAMGDVDDRDAARGEIADDAEQHLHLRRAERGGRLVHQEHARVVHERAGDLDDLLHAERQRADERPRVDAAARASPSVSRAPGAPGRRGRSCPTRSRARARRRGSRRRSDRRRAGAPGG